MYVDGNRLQRRWSNTDGDRVGLWFALGMIVTIVFFVIVSMAVNSWLDFPIRNLKQMRKEQKTWIKKEKADQAKLAAESQKSKERKHEIERMKAAIATTGRQHQEDILAWDISNREVIANYRQLDERFKILEAHVINLEAFETEANELRPRVGEHLDTIRGLRRELAEAKDATAAEKQGRSDLAQRLAFATAELSKHVGHGASNAEAEGSRSFSPRLANATSPQQVNITKNSRTELGRLLNDMVTGKNRNTGTSQELDFAITEHPKQDTDAQDHGTSD